MTWALTFLWALALPLERIAGFSRTIEHEAYVRRAAAAASAAAAQAARLGAGSFPKHEAEAQALAAAARARDCQAAMEAAGAEAAQRAPCQALAAEAERRLAAFAAAAAHRAAPFRRVLAGDKLAVFDAERLAEREVWGPGCSARLRTPADFKAAPVWNEVDLEDDWRTKEQVWSVWQWTFSGMKRLTGPSVREGDGTPMPPKLCK